MLVISLKMIAASAALSAQFEPLAVLSCRAISGTFAPAAIDHVAEASEDGHVEDEPPPDDHFGPQPDDPPVQVNPM